MSLTTFRHPIRKATPRIAGAETRHSDGWTIHTVEEVGSTNSLAQEVPAWHAVRARIQTAGRGRVGHQWVSNRGGLWVSAVLPCPLDEPVWRYFSLAVGWTLIRALREKGVTDIRLRWPNDLMVGRRKLAGILLERTRSESVVVGVGLNVFNTPESAQPELAGTTTRLVDYVDEPGLLENLTLWLLRALRVGFEALKDRGFPAIASELNAEWIIPRRVQLNLAGVSAPVRGHFVGIDPEGKLRLILEHDSREHRYDANQVSLLTELE